MSVLTDRVCVETRGDSDILDLTDDVQALVTKHGFREGQALVFVPGSTAGLTTICLLYTSPSPRDRQKSRMPSSA